MPAKQLLAQAELRGLRENLFRIELETLRKLIDDGIDPVTIALIANISRAIEAVTQLQGAWGR